MTCELAERCSFCRACGERRSPFWKALVNAFCRGPLFAQCQRRQYFRRAGECAPDEILPAAEIPERFRLLD